MEDNAALGRNPRPVYNTILFQLIPGGLYNACPHIQFHALSGLINSRVAMHKYFLLVLDDLDGRAGCRSRDAVSCPMTSVEHTL